MHSSPFFARMTTVAKGKFLAAFTRTTLSCESWHFAFFFLDCSFFFLDLRSKKRKCRFWQLKVTHVNAALVILYIILPVVFVLFLVIEMN